MQQTLFTEIKQAAPATLNLGDPLEAKRFVEGLPETLTAAVADPAGTNLAERLRGLYGGELEKVFERAMRQSLKTGGAYRVFVKDGQEVLLVVTFHLRRRKG